jgi:S-adenosylmethionine:tRNA ribosyltransferase-isomerase
MVRLEDIDYELPAAAIAQVPAEPRDSARLLTWADGRVGHHVVRDLPELLQPGDLVVVNETRVLPARLRSRRATGGAVEVLLLERRGPSTWVAMVRPGRKLAPGALVPVGARGASIRVLDREGETRVIEFVGPDGRQLHADEVDALLAAHGEMPLPPYIRTPLADPDRYQTVYASTNAASAAAPTAGLHLTADVMAALGERGVGVAAVELIVGLDTFKPVTAADPRDHRIHTEAYVVPASTWDACRVTRQRGGRVVAIGTTATRALESAHTTGRLAGRTDLFIHGDHPFGVVDLLLTNFHLPRTTLLLLVEAFTGPRWRELYRLALDEGYRFLSFGDAMLLERRVGPTDASRDAARGGDPGSA